MIFSIILFVISWLGFFFLADKKRIAEISPTCFIAMYLACTSDMMTNVYPLWQYPAPTLTGVFFRHVLHDSSIYPVVTYLFLQTLPKKQTFFTIARHMFYWSILSFFIEWLAIRTGNMKHGLWWNNFCSYTADWLLFITFYTHHKWRDKHSRYE